MGVIRRRYVDLADGQLHYHERGGEAPAIIFLHQTASSAACYDPLFSVLDVPNRLIAIDLPGFGGSFDPAGEPDIALYVRWITEAIDALSVGRFHLFGHHTGASLAIELAAEHRDRALSIMLAGPVFMTATERADFLQHYSEPFRPQADGSHLLANWHYAAQHNANCHPEMMHGEVVAMLRAWRGRAQAYMAVGHHDIEKPAAAVSCPVLLLTSPDDFFHATLDRAQRAFPGAEVAVTGGGNFQPTADPEGVARAITGFLRHPQA